MFDPVARKRRLSWRNRIWSHSVTETCAYIKNKMPSADVEAVLNVLSRHDFTILKYGADYMSDAWQHNEKGTLSFYISIPFGHIYKRYRYGERYGEKDVQTGYEWADRRIKTYLSIMGMYKEDGNEQRMG